MPNSNNIYIYVAGSFHQGYAQFSEISQERQCALMSFSALLCAHSFRSNNELPPPQIRFLPEENDFTLMLSKVDPLLFYCIYLTFYYYYYPAYKLKTDVCTYNAMLPNLAQGNVVIVNCYFIDNNLLIKLHLLFLKS